MHHHRSAIAIFSGAVALGAFAAVGGGAAAATSYGTLTKSRSSSAASVQAVGVRSVAKEARLHTAKTTVDGKTETILVNGRGLPLYYYRLDTAKKSLVTGSLARLWPPLIAESATASGSRGKLTVRKDANGRQVAYNGHFLYTFAADSSGHVTGQGVEDFFVVTPHLKAIGKSTASTTPVASPRLGYGY